MIRPDLLTVAPGRTLIGGAPEGHDARILAELARQSGPRGLLHVAVDDVRMARLAEAIAFFAPEMEVMELPAWDVLPYDRVSPNNAAVSRRIDILTRLIQPPDRPRIVLTTINAFIQRVMPRSALADASRHHRVGQRIRTEELTEYLVRNGYNRAQTVREPGEFASRGDILDLFPPGAAEPLRLDFFGDELEAVRSFDPLSQRTTGKQDELVLKPVAEFFLDEASIARFRVGYRELFGAVTDDDPLYEAVTAGRRHGGMEHWLPLFYGAMESVLDYLPDAAVTLDPQAEQVRDARLAQINDYYGARQVLLKGQRQPGVPVYKPLPPGLLYMPAEEWELVLKPRKVFELSPFAPPEAQASAVDAGGRRGHSFAEERLREDVNLWDAVRAHLTAQHADGRRTVVAAFSTGSRDRIGSLLKEHGVPHVATVDNWQEAARQARKMVAVATLPLESGFTAEDVAVVSEQDILGDRLSRPTRRRRRADKFIQEVTSLQTGDYVVHMDHGIGRYDGLETLTVSGAPHDCLRLVYEGGDKLYVPVENIEVLSRYGSEESAAQLDKLGGSGWQSRKARVKKRLMEMAEELLRIAAAREVRQGEVVEAPAGLYEEFAARFPYPETDDQLRAIEDIVGDLSSGKPMDRLVCGDVGFGKTEVALRAAFLAAMSGLQVAVVVPTTLLARQHYNTFSKRFAGLPVRVAQLSRMVSAKDAKLTRDELARGGVDIVVGTHALLAKGIEFKHLGLLIVDEEQHFGVKQKERLKQLREDIHVLTLTATPIPRTLQLALSGVRELSLIATPPVDRLAVRTFVLPYDPLVIREALMREHYRGGQSFYVCPRIEDLPKLQERLKELVPELKVCTAHGRLAATELEDVMTAFYEGAYDILLATNIIESGLDIPNANTMIVHRADMFGLSQLYQIRGRIGRSKTRGYAYLTHSPGKVLQGVAKSRLHIIETLDQLGAGFTLASHDMDLRGAGNLLGEQQSGHIKEVGIELYQQMLEEAVQAAKNATTEEEAHWSPQINLGIPVLIPETYVADLGVRLGLYRRIADLRDQGEIEGFAAEMIDRFGKLPPEVENLLAVVTLKRLCREAGIDRLDAGPKGAVLSFRNNKPPKIDRLMQFIARQAGSVKLRPTDQKLVYIRVWDDSEVRLQGARHLMQDLAMLAG